MPLMQHDAVVTYHWMSGAQFLNAVALGQVTPGPVVQTVAVVGYAAAGIGGALLAAALAFAPSFGFILAGGSRFDTDPDQQFRRTLPRRSRPRRHRRHRRFGDTARHVVAPPLAGSPVLGGAALWLLLARRSVVGCLVVAGVIGTIVALVGVSV